MSYVITEKCLGERYASCVAVCPVNCIYPGEYKGEAFMAIHPEECISCGACLPECPIGAIIDSEQQDPAYAKINLELSPSYKATPVKFEERPRNDPPKKSTNKLVF